MDDPNGCKFGDWLIFKRDSFKVICRLCHSDVCLKEDEKALSNHGGTPKHSGTPIHCKAHTAEATLV